MSKYQKVWFITGSNSGFGRSLTEAVLAKGDKVVATTRHPEQIKDLVKQYPDTVKTVTLDITKAEEIKDAIDTALAAFGQIDIDEWEKVTLSTSFEDAKSTSLG